MEYTTNTTMYVYIDFCGRRGNQMFQYWVGRYIADQLGWPLKIWSHDHVYMSPSHYPNIRIESIECIRSHEWVQHDQDTNYIDIEKTIHEHRVSGKPVHISKHLEALHLMLPYMDFIKHLYHRPLPKADRIVIHMRLGDIAGYNLGVQKEYIAYACSVLSLHPEKDVLIISEDPFHYGTKEMQSALSSVTKAQIRISKKPHRHYQDDSDDISASTIIIATNSTFSWWAAMMSEHASEVYIFLHPKQFAADARMRLIFPRDLLPSHWKTSLQAGMQAEMQPGM